MDESEVKDSLMDFIDSLIALLKSGRHASREISIDDQKILEEVLIYLLALLKILKLGESKLIFKLA